MKKIFYSQGQVLLELLISISIAALLLAVGSSLVSMGLISTKTLNDRATAASLSDEALEAIESVAHEKWLNLYNLTKNSNYYPVATSGNWTLLSGNSTTTVNGIDYGRSLVIQNICRNFSTDDVTGISDSSGTATTCVSSGGSFDPSSQKITINVNWGAGGQMTRSEYVSRWRNKVCPQTSWTGTGSGTSTCPSALFESRTNISTGTSIQLCNGC